MNIEELIKVAKKRPLMIAGEIKFKSFYHFFGGFLLSRLQNEKIDNKDLAFKREFNAWVQKWIRNNKNIEFDYNSNYFQCIDSICNSEEEKMELFFKLAEEFFGEMNKKEILL